jgi:hypothetical protein
MTPGRYCPQCRTERTGQLRYCSSCAFDFWTAASTGQPPGQPAQPAGQPAQVPPSLYRATVRAQAQGCFSYLGFFVGGGIAAAAWLYLSSGLFDLSDPSNVGPALIWLGGAVVAFLVGGWATATQILVWLAPKR